MMMHFNKMYESWLSGTLINPKTKKVVRLDGIFNYLRYQNNAMYEFVDSFKFSDDFKLNEKLFLIYHNRSHRPLCICGNEITYFMNPKSGYGSFCSNECQRENNYKEWKKDKHPCHREGIQNKVRKTNLKKYGGETPFHSDLIQKKILNNNIMRFGFPKPNQRPDIKLKLKSSLKEFFSNDENKKEWIEKHNKFENKRYSKIADNFFKQLIEDLDIKRDDVRFSEDEYCFRLKERDKFGRFAYYLDFKYGEKVIEFNGDIFHANPEIFEYNDNPNPFISDLTSQKIWDMDSERLTKLKESKLEVLVIWEKDVVFDIEKELVKCKKFIENKELITCLK